MFVHHISIGDKSNATISISQHKQVFLKKSSFLSQLLIFCSDLTDPSCTSDPTVSDVTLSVVKMNGTCTSWQYVTTTLEHIHLACNVRVNFHGNLSNNGWYVSVLGEPLSRLKKCVGRGVGKQWFWINGNKRNVCLELEVTSTLRCVFSSNPN